MHLGWACEGGQSSKLRNFLELFTPLVKAVHTDLSLWLTVVSLPPQVPFIAFYRKEYVEPELHINDLWRVWQWDEKVMFHAPQGVEGWIGHRYYQGPSSLSSPNPPPPPPSPGLLGFPQSLLVRNRTALGLQG